MPSPSQRIVVLAGAVVAALVLATPALATPVTESPANDNVAQAFGPLASGVNYDGQFESVNDVDWLYFYVGGAKQVTVRVTKVGAGCSAYIGAGVRNADGEIVRSDSVIESNVTAEFDYTTTTAGRYYVSLGNDCAGDPYQVNVGPPDAITTVAPAGDEPPVPAPQPTSEPNDSVAAASGPLAPSTAYGGDFATVNDRDWLVFYTTGAVQMRARVTKVGAGCSPYIGASVRDANGEVVRSDSVIESNVTTQFDYTTSAAGRFYVALGNDCAGDPYQVRVGPPEAITASSPLIGFAPTTTPAATPEPNDTPAQAGRIVGGVAYGASIETVNDIDFFRFMVRNARQVDVAITKVGDGCGTALSTSLYKASSPTSAFSGDQSVGRDETTHHQFTSEGEIDYLLRVSGACPGDPYQLRIDPADAVTVPPPPPPDRDGDGTPDAADRCPTVRGTAAAGCPPKVTPGMRLVLLPARDRRKPFRFRIAGSIRGVAPALAAAACGGKVTIRFRNGSRTVATRTAYVRTDCKYGATASFKSRRSFPRARRLAVKASFGGNSLLRSTSRSAFARVR